MLSFLKTGMLECSENNVFACQISEKKMPKLWCYLPGNRTSLTPQSAISLLLFCSFYRQCVLGFFSFYIYIKKKEKKLFEKKAFSEASFHRQFTRPRVGHNTWVPPDGKSGGGHWWKPQSSRTQSARSCTLAPAGLHTANAHAYHSQINSQEHTHTHTQPGTL